MKYRMFLLLATALGCGGVALSAQTAPLTTLSAIQGVTNAAAARHMPVDFEATVIYFRGYMKGRCLSRMAKPRSTSRRRPGWPGSGRPHPGARNHARKFRPFVMSASIERLEHGSLPPAVHATFDDLIRPLRLPPGHSAGSRSHRRCVELLGAQSEHATGCRRRNIDVTVDSDDAAALKGMLDAEVEVTGLPRGGSTAKCSRRAC